MAQLSPQPHNILLRNPPGPSHLTGQDLTGSRPPVDGLSTHCFLPEVIRDLFWRFSSRIVMPALRERLSSEILRNFFEAVKRRNANLQSMSLKNDQAVKVLLSYEYRQGSYREAEIILSDAAYNAKKHGRKEILTQDVKEAMEMNKKILKISNEGLSPREMFANVLIEARKPPENIKLKEVFDYADKIKASIIETKIKSEMQRTGKDLKSICKSEGIEYHNFRKKVVNIIGKNIKELVY